MGDATTSPTCWTRPNDVMRIHRLNLRKKALQARIDNSKSRGNVLQILHQGSDSFSQEEISDTSDVEKRKNPFKRDLSKRFKSFDCGPSSCDFDGSGDNTLFQLLHQTDPADGSSSLQDSFASFLEKISDSTAAPEKPEKKKQASLPVDWSLKSRVRFFSKKNFLWAKNLKTLEEASGTTGFTRCLNFHSEDCGASPSLDTGVNAQFHQCCLVWQHPSIPWLNLFPRSGITASNKSLPKSNTPPLDPAMRECLQKTWRESFRSLLQLVRAHQCPYFYVCANKFTCLFRAAGISGFSEIHALVSPTTSGFRNLLQKDEVVYSMPLRKESRERKASTSSPPDLGYDTQDSVACSPDQMDSDLEDLGEEEGEEEAEEWLQSMGVADAQIKKLNSQAKHTTTLSQDDRRPESLVQVVKDEEIQALFNMLLNCNSIYANTGALAGVPPTLLAPVAFHGATLKPLTVGQRIVNLSGEQFQCVEVSGPMLPHTLRDLCNQLERVQPQFSVCCSTVEHTKSFSQLPTPENAPITSAFARENLRDCGLAPHTLHMLCQPVDTQVLESVKFTDGNYTCQD